MGDTVYMPAMRTARDAKIWWDQNSLPGDTVVATSALPQEIDTNPQSSTFGKRVYPVIKGRKLTNGNPISKPHLETFSLPGVNDGIPVVELQAAQDPRTGGWYGGKIEGFTIRGGNQKHDSSAHLDIQGQTGVYVNPYIKGEAAKYQSMCAATLCTITEVYHDGYNGPGGTNACWFEWVCRMAQILHNDGNYMKNGHVDNCHRAYAAELYGQTYHVLHGMEISGMKFYGNPGYWDYPVAAGNGYDFGLRYNNNEGDEWAWAGNWNFLGFMSSAVEIGWNKFTHKWRDSAVDLRNVVGGSVHDNMMPCDPNKGFARFHKCQYVDSVRNNVNVPNQKQSEVW